MIRGEQERGDGHSGLTSGNLERFKSAKTRARFVAGKIGCPVPEKTLKRQMAMVAREMGDTEHPGRYWHRGAIETTILYSRYIYCFRLTLGEIEERAKIEEQKGERGECEAALLRNFAEYLDHPISRRAGQQLTGEEPGAVPRWVKELIPTTERYENYVLPRLLASYIFEWGPKIALKEDPLAVAFGCLRRTVDELDPAADFETNANILVAATAERLVAEGKANSDLVLKRLFSAGKLQLDQFYREYIDALGTMEELEKGDKRWGLTKRYRKINPQEREKLGIADPNFFKEMA